MTRLFIGELVIFILAVVSGGVRFTDNPRAYYVWGPTFFIAVIALLMMLKVFFV